MTNRIDLDALEAAEKAATKGPWKLSWIEWHTNGGEEFPWRATALGPDHEVGYDRDGNGAQDAAKADTVLITLLRNSAPALIAELRAARRVVEAVKHNRAMVCRSCDGGDNYAECTCNDVVEEEFAAIAAYDAATAGGGEG